MFKSWDSHAVWTWFLTWQCLSWVLNCLHDVTRESAAALTDHFAYAFCRKSVVCIYKVVATQRHLKVDADAILFREILPNGLVFKQLPGDSANEENMCDPYNLNPLPTGKFCVFFCCLLRFFSKSTFLKNSCKIPSECQTVWVQIRPDVLSGLIWVQIVFKWYQQMALVDKKLISTHHSVSVGLDTFCFSNSYWHAKHIYMYIQ